MLGNGLSVMTAAVCRRPFTPVDLFAGGAQGLFLDWRDTSTLFQDAAGILPSAPSGDLVKLGLDKSRGLARGVNFFEENPVTAVNWTDNGDGSFTAQGLNGTLNVMGLSAGEFGELQLTIAGSGADSLNLFDGDNNFLGSFTGDGSHRAIFKASGSARPQLFNLNKTSFTGTVSGLSLRTVAGKHCLAPADAARATYQADRTLADDGDDSLIAPLTGTFSAYIAADGALIADEGVVMADNYDVLRNNMVGAVIVSAPLTATQQQQVAAYFGVTV
ncbi:hypothetical protein K3725_09700 [Leisingera sp. S132]|uniref:hypothetical protein n=1 Tax=Leisingera sp. S132 TaxID=2867016 RepID=UPI0021A71025|nr:hypothetical protein [Leisingera sp. S132]UWQ77597.1 hypothetical protein K3725_09700 [Leisingera sp. S132]